MAKLTHTIIEAAIHGFEAQKQTIDAQIAELRAMLTGATESASYHCGLRRETRSPNPENQKRKLLFLRNNNSDTVSFAD